MVQVLEEIFGKDRETATRIMLETHGVGFGICGINPYDIAEAKVTEVLSFTRRHGRALQCVLERSIIYRVERTTRRAALPLGHGATHTSNANHVWVCRDMQWSIFQADHAERQIFWERRRIGWTSARADQRVGPASAPIRSLMEASNWLAEAATVNLASS